MKNVFVLCVLAACGGNDTSRHIVDGNGSGGGTGVPEPCNMMISSSIVTATATDTQCGQLLVDQTTVAINFKLTDAGNNMLMSEIACTIMPGVVPQTLGNRSGTAGCNAEIDYFAAAGATYEWDNASSGTLTVTVTDLAPLGGMIDVSLTDATNGSMTVTGTF